MVSLCAQGDLTVAGTSLLQEQDAMNSETRRKLRNFVIEMILYSVMVSVYLWLAITYLADWLVALFNSNLIAYAIVAILFIVAQSVLLDSLTSFIMDRLGVERLR
jgi:uncharacterized membrane protein (DUF485 family)